MREDAQWPEGYTQILKLSDRELGFLAAAKLFELGRFTASQAAKLVQMDRLSFLAQLAPIGVPAINLREEEVEGEIEAARELAG